MWNRAARSHRAWGDASTSPSGPSATDVTGTIGGWLPEFTEKALRESYRAETVPVVLGALRAREMFPASNRFRTRRLVAWEQRTRATLLADDAFDLIFDPARAHVMPYTVLPVQWFGRPLAPIVRDVQRALGITEDGFALVWIGSGGHVTPLHNDGPWVHGRRHLVVAGRKTFDLLPPRFRGVRRTAPWDLYRRFSALYKEVLPVTWFDDGPGVRAHLEPGHMLTWDRQWWHRVEISNEGVTVALSTRGQQEPQLSRSRKAAAQLSMRLLGDVETLVEPQVDEAYVLALADVDERCRCLI